MTRGHYDDRAHEYHWARPGYPSAVLELIARWATPPRSLAIADVGSGTGILARMLVNAGHTVFGVEPSTQMRTIAEAELSGSPLFVSVAGRAEETSLRSRSVDVVTAAQSFHWFDPVLARKEFIRILRPGGIVVLLWNERRLDGSPFLRDLDRLYCRMQADNATDSLLYDTPVDVHIERLAGRLGWSRMSIRNEQTLNERGLVARILSTSFAPSPSDPRHERWEREIESLYRAHATPSGVRLEYDTIVALGTLD